MGNGNGTPLQALKFALSAYFETKAATAEDIYAFLCAWELGDVGAYQPALREFCAANPDEP